MLWWIIGILAVWLLVGGVAAYWLGRSISHTELEESAAELRRDHLHPSTSSSPPEGTPRA